MPQNEVKTIEIGDQVRVFINNIEIKPNNGEFFFSYDLIKDIEIKELLKVSPIFIEKDNSHGDPIIAEIHTLIEDFCIYVLDDITMEVLVTMPKPSNIDNSQINPYIIKYQEVINNHPDVELVEEVDPEDGFVIELQRTEEADALEFNQYPIGPIQFFVILNGFCFKDLYNPLLKILKELDSKTRKKLGI